MMFLCVFEENIYGHTYTKIAFDIELYIHDAVSENKQTKLYGTIIMVHLRIGLKLRYMVAFCK